MMASGSGAPVPIFFDWVETTDAYAFIDPKVTYLVSTGIKTDITAFPTTLGTYAIACGFRNRATTTTRMFTMMFTQSNYIGFGFGSERTYTSNAYTASHKKVRMVSTIKNGSQKFEYYRGTETAITFSYTYTSSALANAGVTLFKARAGSGTTLDTRNGGVRMWACKIYSSPDATSPVRDFRPCTYNGEAGLWDMVEGKFYGNANTQGSFSVGND